MPSGSKKQRPDTLELETFTRPRRERVADQLPGNPSQGTDEEESRLAQNERADSAAPTARTKRRWFHFGRSNPTNTSTANDSEAEPRGATLAKPETTTIGNSATTIASPPSDALPSSQTIPDVAAVLSRSNSKRRQNRKQKSEALFSIATLGTEAEKTAENLNSGDGEVSCASPASHEVGGAANDRATIFIDDGITRQQYLLNSETLADDSKEGDWKSCLMSFLGKLAIWKHSACHSKQRKKRRKSWTSSHTTTESGALEKCGDFEGFTTTPVSGFGSGGMYDKAGGKESSGLRRLSQVRRRRSSYYFSENERRIRANNREFNAQFKYTDNYIKTSKYSLLTFLPFNLLEQFQRLANFYFLCLLVLQLIPAISSLTPVTTAIPLIGVLTLTAVKDAYDDIQRHLSDSQVNNRKSKALRNGKLVDEKWAGVQVGDVIRLENNQFVAADILLLSTSEPNGLCFIETAELDGETNLKCKQCLPETIELGQHHDLLWNFNGEIICERPNNLLNKFEGTLMWRNQRFALDNEKVLLRGCVLRNTQWCYGVVIYAGNDTKLMQNSGKTQFKSTGVDRLLNFIIIGIVLFLLSICAFFTVACGIWEYLIGQHFQVYLPWENLIPKSVPEGATVIGLLVFFSYAIVLNTVVPISLYVSVEVIRFAQSFLINWDEQMYYEPTKTHAKARTTTLNEELGQIQYIFSDKTGTLTRNIMTFNKCSINGRSYGDVIDLRTGEVIEMTDKHTNFHSYTANNTTTTTTNNNQTDNNSTASPQLQQQHQQQKLQQPPPTILLHKAEVHPKSTVVVAMSQDSTYTGHIAGPDAANTTANSTEVTAGQSTGIPPPSPVAERTVVFAGDEMPGPRHRHTHLSQPNNYERPPPTPSSPTLSWSSLTSSLAAECKPRLRRQASSTDTLPGGGDKALQPIDFSSNPQYEPDFRWFDRTLLDAVRSDEEHAHNFFRLLALCHTVMPEYVDGRLEYQAQSPDESALVSAARNFGFVFRSRTPNSITIEVMGKKEEYELLHILDFNNVRKRMSVILRRGRNIVLYCKGADNVIYDRLSSSQNDIKVRTQEHLNKFAGEGLRTLVLAERRLDTAYYEEWRQRQQEAAVTLDHREDKLAAIYEEVESEMVLVGVTAIEDKLQDGVPETIANLQMAGIKIWVLTGDKQETAINIGYSCQLLTDELADVFIVDGSSREEVEIQLRQFRDSIRIVNRFRPTPVEPQSMSLNGSNRQPSTTMLGSSVFRAQVSPPAPPPPPPAISVVTFSAECNEYYDNLEKGNTTDKEPMENDLMVDDGTGFAIVINGHSLVHCLSPELESRFLEIASQCKAVICCRVTPLQKALVVELIKRAKNAVTLAIGDGANDVSMIKAAHIGVGISGQEGLQAVLASDYSIAQFRYLERLLLVHGRWSYYRMCKFLRYFFYKNFAFTLCHCWYSFFCGFSAQTVFDPMFISVYNLFYTSLPVLALGVFEQDVSDKHSVEYPKLYTPGLKSQLFNTKEFVYSVLHGAFSSLILFLIPYGTYKDGVSPNGLILSDHMTLGAVVATILIIDNTAQIALYTSYWTIFNHITIWGSLVWYFVLDYFYNYVIGGPYVGSLTQAMKDLTFWVTMFITVTMIMAPVLAYKFYLLAVHPSLSDKIRYKRRQADLLSRQTHSSVTRTPSARKARRSLRSGYAFAHQEGFGRLITSGKIMRKLPQELAFPLGLGSKRMQTTPTSPTNVFGAVQNNNNTPGGKDGGSNNVTNVSPSTQNGGSGGSGDDDISPRAPYQDLDTINL